MRRHGINLLAVALLLLLFSETHALKSHSTWYADGDKGILTTVDKDIAVMETIQWAPANSCACPAVQCPFMNESSPPCQVSCASRQSAVCRCAMCQGIGGIVRLSGFNSCYCVTPQPSGGAGGRSR